MGHYPLRLVTVLVTPELKGQTAHGTGDARLPHCSVLSGFLPLLCKFDLFGYFQLPYLREMRVLLLPCRTEM